MTGTSGKSSTVYLLCRVLEAAGHTVGTLSTIEFCVAGGCKLNDKKMTMLGRTQIQKYLRQMVRAGCEIAIIETTSEGYLQHRHRFIEYDTIVLTNLYPEHIEAHGGFENYKAAKLGIFQYVAARRRKALQDSRIEKIAIVNGESEHADEFLSFPFDKKIRFQPKDFPKRNDACVFSIAKTFGIADDVIKNTLASISGVPGRIEYIEEAKRHGFTMIVDYAFEPVAMNVLYEEVERLLPKRIIHVFGSTGGGRDRSRRFTIGKFVSDHATICIVTDEDPYDDDPMEIIRDVASVVTNPVVIPDRRKAIETAVSMAMPGDVVLITGKGSEQGMVVKGRMVPWDDRRVARDALLKIYV